MPESIAGSMDAAALQCSRREADGRDARDERKKQASSSSLPDQLLHQQQSDIRTLQPWQRRSPTPRCTSRTSTQRSAKTVSLFMVVENLVDRFGNSALVHMFIDLRRLLYIYFSTYGKVLDVVALRNDKMRGQAFVVFKDLSTSTAALRKENGRAFAGRALKIQYAQSKSFATIENESGKEALYQYRMGIIQNPDASRKLTVSGAGKALSQNKRDRAGEGEEEDETEDGAKKARLDGDEEEEEMEMSEGESDS